MITLPKTEVYWITADKLNEITRQYVPDLEKWDCAVEDEYRSGYVYDYYVTDVNRSFNGFSVIDILDWLAYHQIIPSGTYIIDYR